MLEEMGRTGLPIVKDLALNERDYGDLSGLNKDDAREKWGEEQVLIWRRSYDIAPPGGESLKDTLARTLPYYVTEILPRVLRGERVLVAAHGNSLRALVMVLEKLSPEHIPQARDRHRRADHLSNRSRRTGDLEARSRRIKKSAPPCGGALSEIGRRQLDDLRRPWAAARVDDHAAVVDVSITELRVLRNRAQLHGGRHRFADDDAFLHRDRRRGVAFRHR